MIKIPTNECHFSFARSSGPGGQNVNKVNSKAVMRWPLSASSSLPDEIKNRFIAKYAKRITIEGDLILTSQKYRDQSRNVDDCLEKFAAMIISVAIIAAPRQPTRPTLASKRRRHQSKERHSQKKQHRRFQALDDS
jgi:ribosome-associated protein